MAKANPRVVVALARMAILRQAPELTETDFTLFAAELESEGVPVEHIEEACRRIGREPREDGQTAFPSLGTLLAECKQVRVDTHYLRLQELAARAPKELMPPAEDFVPLSREEAKKFVDRLKAEVEARRVR